MQLSIPEQQATPGVDTRPGPLRAWLAGLPYVDSENTARQVVERLRDINHQLLPAGHRLELLAAFRHSYERLHDALRQLSRQQDTLTQPPASTLLIEFTEAMGFGYKYALRDAVDDRQRWGRARQVSEAANYTLHFLALLLVCRYQSYQPTPGPSWREIGELVRFAETQALAATRDGDLPCCAGELHVLSGYRQLALLRLADPYRLATGLVWEAYGYLAGKTGQVRLLSHSNDEGITGIYGLALDHEPQQSLPAPISGVERSSWRWLDARELLQSAQMDLERLASGTHPHRLGFSARLSSADAVQLLSRMLGQWTHSQQRKSPRVNSTQEVALAPGLDAAYYFLNNCVAFDPLDFAPPEDEDDIDYSLGLRRGPSSVHREFRLVTCPTRNRSGGGLALRLEGLHSLTLRVGQLVLIDLPAAAPGAASDWLVAVVRWLVGGADARQEVGLQYVARNSIPAALRATSGAQQTFHPALKSELVLADGQRLLTLISAKGLYKTRAVLELQQGQQLQQIRCDRLLDAGNGFDRFSYEVLA